jgi:hypothetical protein
MIRVGRIASADWPPGDQRLWQRRGTSGAPSVTTIEFATQGMGSEGDATKKLIAIAAALSRSVRRI